jgi:hypothetical protein
MNILKWVLVIYDPLYENNIFTVIKRLYYGVKKYKPMPQILNTLEIKKLLFVCRLWM